MAVLKLLVLTRSGHLGEKVGPMAEKCASESWAIFLHICMHACAYTHSHTHNPQKYNQLQRLFGQAFNCISVCFSVTGSESKFSFLVFSFLKENIL